MLAQGPHLAIWVIRRPNGPGPAQNSTLDGGWTAAHNPPSVTADLVRVVESGVWRTEERHGHPRRGHTDQLLRREPDRRMVAGFPAPPRRPEARAARRRRAPVAGALDGLAGP